MYERRASAIAVLLAGIAFLAAGCSSSSAPSAASSSTAPASSPSAAATPTAAADALPSADCAILKPISASAISTLESLASDSKAKAAAAMKSYIAQLETAEGKLTSAQAKADLEPLITGLEKSATETQAQSTPVITAALGKLGAACP